MRDRNLQRAILCALKDAHPFLLPQKTLFAEANLRASEPVSKIEFEAKLRELEGQKRIICVKDEDDAPKWKITDNGLARIMEIGC